MSDRFLLDSDICIYLLKGLSERLSRRVRQQDEGTLLLSAISLAEVGLGARADAEQDAALHHLLVEVAVAPFDAMAAARYTTLPFRRSRFDRLIAAHALALDVTLVTNNEVDFSDIRDLRVENWTR